MSAGKQVGRPKRRRTPAYQDYLNHKLWLRSCGAVLRAAYADRMKSEELNDEDKFGLAFDMLTIVEAVDDCLKLADLRMRHGDEQEQATVAEMLLHQRRVLKALPSVAQHVEVVERAVRIADESGVAAARDDKAELDDRRMGDRQAIAGPIIAAARRKAEEAGKQFSLKNQLEDVRAALEAAGLPKVSLDTLRRDMKRLPKSAG